jgi:hypothetical protein
MARNRFDETWHRLREWTKGQAQSERLAGQILIHAGFLNFDPSHPLGGPDGGRDGIATKAGISFAMAVYFPRGEQKFQDIKAKFEGDLAGARRNSAQGMAFVTNQELTLSEREIIATLASPMVVELYHLERITAILDTPGMAKVREQFLDIEMDRPVFEVGGRGGTAPSSGGGGGGAIGEDATGGREAPGGISSTFPGLPAKRRPLEEEALVQLERVQSVARAEVAENTSLLRWTAQTSTISNFKSGKAVSVPARTRSLTSAMKAVECCEALLRREERRGRLHMCHHQAGCRQARICRRVSGSVGFWRQSTSACGTVFGPWLRAVGIVCRSLQTRSAYLCHS